MVGFLQLKTHENFDIEGGLAVFIQHYYNNRKNEGKYDESWVGLLEDNYPSVNLDESAPEDLISLYTQDVVRSWGSLTAGNIVLFNYTSIKKQLRKAYFALIVATKRGNGLYSVLSTKNTLMSCFLIDSGTDLNTLAHVVDVINDEKIKQQNKAYKSITNNKSNRDIREKAGVSEKGMSALFPTTDFRTFAVNVGMGTIYKVSLNG